jgi:hypothetical protein
MASAHGIAIEGPDADSGQARLLTIAVHILSSATPAGAPALPILRVGFLLSLHVAFGADAGTGGALTP